MSYEGRHWSCGHDRKECDGHCYVPLPSILDCERCGHDAMICECPPEPCSLLQGAK